MQSPDTIKRLEGLDRDLIKQRLCELAVLRAAGDVEGMLRYAAPDIVYNVGNWRAYPFNHPREGKDAFADMGHAVNVAYENLGSTMNRILIDGDSVALQRTAKIRNRGTGRTISVEICNFLRFRDGLVVEFSEYPDTKAFAQLDNPDE